MLAKVLVLFDLRVPALVRSRSFGADTQAATTLAASGDVLDQKKIHSNYNDGSFERVITSLEAFMSRNPVYSLEDSIFIAKHVAVVYTANPQTREKGKYFMYRLPALLPTAKLVDMYVSGGKLSALGLFQDCEWTFPGASMARSATTAMEGM